VIHKHNNAGGLKKPNWRAGAFSFFAVCMVLLSLDLRSQATVLLNDTFSDGDRTNQGLPASAHWYSGGPGTNVSVTDSGLTFRDSSASKATAMAYFTPTELRVGQSLTLSFNYRFEQLPDGKGNGDDSFMFGLYNSGGQYQTKDSVGFNNKIFEDYTGYATSGVFGPDSSSLGLDYIQARDKEGKDLLSMDTYTQGKTFKQSGGATPGQIYAAGMQIARTAEGLTVTSQIGDTTVVQKYTSEMFTKFDAVGIFANGNVGSFSLDNVKMDYTGAPEPSSFFAVTLFGLAVFGKMLGGKLKDLFLNGRRSLTA